MRQWSRLILESMLTSVDLRVDHQMQFLPLKVCVNILVLIVSQSCADCWHV